MTDTTIDRYLAPDGFTRRVLNPLTKALMKLGVKPRGGRLLLVRGRVSGNLQQVPVNPLDIDGTTYLVAPRGNTQWVRNLRSAGRAQLRTGRRTDEIMTTELDDAAKPSILRAYLSRWAAETGRFFDGADATSNDEALAALAPGIPVFRIRTER